MKVDNGALDFDATMDNGQLNQAIDEATKKIQGFADTAESSGQKLDDMFDLTEENINIQKKVINDLENEYANLKIEINKLKPGSAQDELIRQAKDLELEIDAEKVALKGLQQTVEETGVKTQSLRQRKRELIQELANMEMAGQRDTQKYREMRDELAVLTDQMADTTAQARKLASDTATFDGMINGLSGVVGGFTAAQGAIGLFAGENENLQKIMLKVQSLMSITMGLQQLQNTLDKDSAFRLVTLNQLKELWAKITGKQAIAQTAETAATNANTRAETANAAATAGAAAAQTAETVAAGAGTVANWSLAGAFRAVGLAIKSIPVFGWIVAGISALIGVVEMFTDSTDDETESIKKSTKALQDQEQQMSASDRVMKAAGEASQETKAKIEILTGIIHDNALAIDVRKKAIKQLKTIIPGYNAMISNEGVITRENTKAVEDYIDALDRMALAKAVQSELEKLDQKQLQARIKQTKAQQQIDKNVWAENQEKQRQSDFNNPNVQRSDATNVVTAGTQQEMVASQKAKSDLSAARKNMESAKKEMDAIQKDKKVLKQIFKEDNLASAFVEEPNLNGKSGKGGKGGSGKNDPEVKTYKEKLAAIKALYDDYNKWRNSSDEKVRQAANVEFAYLIKQGASYMAYLEQQRSKLEATGVKTAAQKSKLKDLNDAIANATKETVINDFQQSLKDQLSSADNVLQKLDMIAEKRKELSGDGSDIDKAESDALDQAQKAAEDQLKDQTKNLLTEYQSYVDKRLQMEKQFQTNVAILENARKAATDPEDQEKIQRAIENMKGQFDQIMKSSGDSQYDQLLDSYRTFEENKTKIHEDFEEKRRIATQHGDQGLVDKLNNEEAKAQMKNSFDALKASPDYVRAFEDLKSVSTETLKSLLKRFDEVKEAAARDMNPEDLREYMQTIQSLIDEMNSRNPFAGMVKGYKELKAAAKEVEEAEKNLKKIRDNGGTGTEDEVKAINKVNKAKDKFMKKNKEVRSSEKTLKNQVGQLCDELDNVGKAIGGEAGDIISLIADIGNFVMSSIDSFKAVTAATAQAMSTMEKASVILTVISMAFTLAQKIASLFGDGGEADYKRASEVYKEYISVLDDVIDKQKELMETMSGEDAKNSYKYALQLVQEQTDAARELGKQYLNTGAKSGFFGIGSKASHGVDQRKNISSEAWNQLRNMANQGIISLTEYSNIAKDRMTGLFDLSASQIQWMREHAPVFWANLAEETRTYLEQIAECADQTAELGDKMKESLTGVDFSSMSDDFVSQLEDMDAKAKDVAESISEYMRKALIKQMFLANYKDQLQKWYDMWADAMDPDGEGGTSITDQEQKALDTLRDSIVNGATAAAKQINDQFRSADDQQDAAEGSVQSVTEETAGKIEGQMQAIRINQMEALEHMRQALVYLAIISSNSGYLVKLNKLDQILEKMGSDSDTLRGQGLA